MKKRKSKILLLIGTYPPPLGGIATHLLRLTKYLKAANINYMIINPGYSKGKHVLNIGKPRSWYLFINPNKKNQVVHFHKTIYGFEYFYWFLFSRISNNQLFITLHNENLLDSNCLIKRINILLLRKTNYTKLIIVSEKVSAELKLHNIDNIYLPAHVPVSMQDVEECKLDYHSNKTLFIFSMSKVTRNNSDDIYGFDLALKVLKDNENILSMVLMIGDKERSDINYIKSTISKQGLIENVIVVYNEPLINVMKQASFLLRANRKDGYGISLQEAMELGALAIGSDVCTRPAGTILFKSGNELNLADVIRKVMRMSPYQKKEVLSSMKRTVYHKKLIQIYAKSMAR